MSAGDTAPLCVIEEVTRLLPRLERRELRSECGRLILVPDALHFVQGWEVRTIDFGGTGGIFGAFLELAVRAPEVVDTRAEGARMLAEVRSLAPAEQVRAIAGSVTVPASDIDTARLGYLSGVLEVVTEAQGEVLRFDIAWGRRREVRAWLAGLPRR